MIAQTLAAQLAKPSGTLGRIVAAVMNRSNAAMNRRATALLEIQPTHHVLDIGFGGGVSLGPLLKRTPSGCVYGVEPSALMCAHAIAQHVEATRRRRLRLTEGTAEKLPYGEHSMDRVLTVNTIYFWKNPRGVLREVRRVTRADGRFVLAYRSASLMRRLPTSRGFHLHEDEAILRLLADTGFEVLAMETRRDDGVGYCCLVATPWAVDG